MGIIKTENSGSASSGPVPDVSWEFGLKEKKTHICMVVIDDLSSPK